MSRSPAAAPGCLAFALSLALSACARPAPAERPTAPPALSHFLRVEAVGLDARGAALVAEADVTFDEERVAAIIAPVQGRVMRLLAAPGDRVAAGDPLATIYSAEVAGAGAGLSQARIA
ncbi:MAG: Barrel-sandwich domain of CusB or HlyD rane-fusion, partial [Myxococcaceae bacterium]|nr:Barrel-sandwich domain of CusB or HlyD rane-fusion [Myxococcaceae bacterium]